MRTLCLALVMGLCLTGCSRSTQSSRMERAYYKHLDQAKKEKEKRQKEQMKNQRSDTIHVQPSMLPPLQQPMYEPVPDGQ